MAFKFTPELKKLIQDTGSPSKKIALAATAELAKALELPLRKGVLSGDITGGIFETIVLPDGAVPEFPLDFIAPGTEDQYVAYTLPNHGYIPERHVEGDYVTIPTYPIGAAIDWARRYAKSARWDVVRRALEVMRGQFVKKINDDAWQTILSAAYDRNIVVADTDAAAGQFTKRLISLMKTVMRRNGKLTDLYLSPEAVEDIRNWNVDQVDEVTRREIYVAEDGAINRIFSVNLTDLDELGEGQEYQNFYDNELSGSLPSGDVELVVGLDLANRDSFVMPVVQEVEIFEDEALHRQRKAGFYGEAELGIGVLSGTRVLLGAL
jgi:hypothetical protein